MNNTAECAAEDLTSSVEVSKEEDPMKPIIERLRWQRGQAKKECEEEGCTAGRSWAQEASYRELLYAAEVFNPLLQNESYYNPWLVVDDNTLGDYFREAFAEFSLGLPEDGDDCLTDLTDAWLDGWFKGVKAFWREVSIKI